MSEPITLDSIRDALKRVELGRQTTADVVLLREWISRQEATVTLQANRIAELTKTNAVLSELLDEEG